MPPLLTRPALTRALLARQFLLERTRMPVRNAVEHLVGLQAQAPKPPYFALWSRLDGFEAQELSLLLQSRELVRLSVMRGTVHLVGERDALWLRALTQPLHESMLRRTYAKRLGGEDPWRVAEAARELLAAEPLTTAQLGVRLQERWPHLEARALAMTARYLLALVQLPPRGLWGRSGQPVVDTVERWLGRPPAREARVETMVLRYLGAFGPASVQDAQTWSGLTRLGEVLERLRPQLRVFKDEEGRELFDLPEAPRPDAELPLPVRFLAEYDNLVLSHADRSRVLDEPVRRHLATRNGQVPGTFLVDGRVRGIWKADTTRPTAVLTLTPFGPLPEAATAALAEEGQRLLAFATDGRPGPHTVTFAAPVAAGSA
ncbi:winged helix DNA-binding domain-containing protein [Streptomyces albus]|uniref:Winged helix DNA-binding domain-containing protein n=2 Tax=Streptomyces albus TaxID=1888 RepID=A0A8H1L6Y5_9ACTN|nr:winged helix DNA-binding domain-containing protein [Streptomyces albus]TGG77355.1 winged helix DNA-binding domain-containing protein [Streptomyces albus]UVN56657.1 winged helix DNA-binding domain-containing protein [Streptomyces albus]